MFSKLLNKFVGLVKKIWNYFFSYDLNKSIVEENQNNFDKEKTMEPSTKVQIHRKIADNIIVPKIEHPLTLLEPKNFIISSNSLDIPRTLLKTEISPELFFQEKLVERKTNPLSNLIDKRFVEALSSNSNFKEVSINDFKNPADSEESRGKYWKDYLAYQDSKRLPNLQLS